MSMPAQILIPNVTLDQLLQGMVEAPPIPISGISSDSRNLEEGNLFVACQGKTSHGLDFLDQAVDAKVAAVVCDAAPFEAQLADIPIIQVAGLAGHLGTIANRFFDTPSKRVKVTGVTGTNGKTTVAYLIMQCLHLLGRVLTCIGSLRIFAMPAPGMRRSKCRHTRSNRTGSMVCTSTLRSSPTSAAIILIITAACVPMPIRKRACSSTTL